VEEWAWRIVNTKEVTMKKIQILGTGCPKCKKLTELAEKAAKELDLQYVLEKVTNLNDIMNFGVMVTPALVVDGEVKIAGKVPKIDDIKRMLS
jgi:small redox-active disulfide protein 2